MQADQEYQPTQPKKKKKRSAVDVSLIVNEPRSRKRRAGSSEVGSAVKTTNFLQRARTSDEFAEVARLGNELYEALLRQNDPHDPSRPLWPVFAELPPATDFPEYYRMIKKPISLKEIKDKLDSLSYVCLDDVRGDINQMFVNAKRFNAKGSPIFLDAKRLHKTLREQYAVLTGEAPAPDEDDIHVDEPAGDINVGDDDGEYGAPGGKQMKKWLTKKLSETMRRADDDGRSLIEYFRTLPSRLDYPDYYQLIKNPVAFDIIKGRINKLAYPTVQRFMDDVNQIFENAMFYNQEESIIWQDAALMKVKFAEIMREIPPDFSGTSTAKRQQALRRGSSAHPEGDEQEDGSEYANSRAGSVQPGFDFPKLEDPTSDPYGYASPALTPAAASPVIGLPTGLTPTLPAIPLPGLSSIPEGPNPLLGLASLAAFSPNANGTSGLDASMSPVLANGSASRPATSRSASSEVFHPRRVAKLPTVGEFPLIAGFSVSSTPSSLPSITLDNSHIRQHSFSIPFCTERLSFSPVFRSSSSLSNGKGKEPAVNGNGASNGHDDGPPPSITIRAKPSSLSFEAVAPPASEGEDLAIAQPGQARYVLVPRKGLNVVEFVVRPAGAAEGEGEEVYRCFVTN
ncbi:hypothetical protein JCM8547_003764 [Rhodosporidiobolus lusitaniae]